MGVVQVQRPAGPGRWSPGDRGTSELECSVLFKASQSPGPHSPTTQHVMAHRGTVTVTAWQSWHIQSSNKTLELEAEKNERFIPQPLSQHPTSSGTGTNLARVGAPPHQPSPLERDYGPYDDSRSRASPCQRPYVTALSLWLGCTFSEGPQSRKISPPCIHCIKRMDCLLKYSLQNVA